MPSQALRKQCQQRAVHAREAKLRKKSNLKPRAAGNTPPEPLRVDLTQDVDAYCTGMSAKDAQLQFRAYGSKQYKSHQRVPERIARQFDQ
jgi:hypothetical protein